MNDLTKRMHARMEGLKENAPPVPTSEKVSAKRSYVARADFEGDDERFRLKELEEWNREHQNQMRMYGR